ncbi:SusC/RagA family TonB-linked outer membrane protein [Parapedobacter deserti]|uniref:SusC/RagA family TonB-linked outer membrane protein n=1 Tax=Parapedobacter deserti TaxID=1912957 RepID=A0ABV7JKK9_9SPHI
MSVFLQWRIKFSGPNPSRLVTAFKLVCCLNLVIPFASWAGVSQTLEKVVTIQLEEKNVPEALDKLAKLTGANFSFTGSKISGAGPVKASFKEQKLSAVLNSILTPHNLEYKAVGQTIVINVAASKKAAPILIVGVITDEVGEPLPGVSIKIKNSEKGTTSDVNGKYSISVPDRTSILVFSYIGSETVEEMVGARKTINIILKSSSSRFDEVVVTGYGDPIDRKDLVGSVGKVNMEDLNKAPVVSFDQALAGRVAGVQVSSVDGQPGSAINIVIRGANSITQDNSPLYVIDGFPIEDNENPAINPADIESIDVLKDAASTSIYGSRGSNGVIMITTKRGKAGAPRINYDGYQGFQTISKAIPVLDPYEFVKLQFEIDSNYTIANYLNDGKTIESYREIKGIDWQDKVFNTAPFGNHHISMSGGDNKTRYTVSGSITNQDGILVNSGFKRYQGRVTLDQNVNDKLKVGISANYSDINSYGTIVTNNNSLPSASFMYAVWSFRPTAGDVANLDFENELFDPSIDPNTDYRVNPYMQAKNELRQSASTSLLSNVFAEYKFNKHLKLRVTGAMNRSGREAISFYNSSTRQGSPRNPQSLGVNGGRILFGTTNLSNENMLIYNRKFGQHHLDFVVDYSQQRSESYSSGATAVQVPNESLGISGIDEGTPRSITAASSAWALQSVLGRVNYRYKSKYALSASLRTDGSSKFAAGNRWSYFSSLGVSYRLSEEEFIKDLSFLSDAKLRINYGSIGNNRVNDFASLSSIAFPVGFFYSFGNSTPSVGGGPVTLGNPTLKWETTNEVDFGIDVGFIEDKIRLTADYYKKVTSNLLLNAQLPTMTGYTSAFENIGKVSNSGFELSISSDNISTENFRWNSNFNIAFNRNKVLALTRGQESITTAVGGLFNTTPLWIAKIGQPIAMFYGVLSDGLYQYEDFNQLANGRYVLKDEVPANGLARNIIQPGFLKYRDLNNDGNVTATDFTVIGNPNPDFIGGFTNNFFYKGFDLNVFFQFSYGNDIMNANRIVMEGANLVNLNTNMYATYANRWTPSNTNTTIPSRAGAVGQPYYSNRTIEDGSYLRLKTVSLGYTLPAKLTKSVGVSTMRFYSSAQNLLTITGYSGPDPEVSTRHSALTTGLDFSSYPRAKTLVFGLQLTL